ncbi:MAG: hypothetical protein KGD59_00265 [Candidatus Heimdallarchaeota archaeon]|nr:hypothetical protein [Candidatus Heimdallarchaeota archaeon]MBY8992953.1 hypothetical protein [Candidatus Heimdallarchaeota archaeon]
MKRLRRTIRYLYLLFCPILVLTVGLAIYFLPEPYRFFQDYLSELGAQLSVDNLFDNQISSVIFSVGFGLCALISIIISILYVASDFRYKYLKGSLNLIIAFGASLVAIPQDKGNLLVLHTIGAALFVAAFGILNFTDQLLRFVRKRQEIPEEKKFDYYLDTTIVVVVFVVIFLLIIFFIPSEITKNPTLILLSIIFQKLVLIVDCLALLVLDLDDI